MTLDVPPDATDAEVAAIAVAVCAHLDQCAAVAALDAETDSSRADERWRFAGRLAALGAARRRIPAGAPADDWTAAGRTDRF